MARLLSTSNVTIANGGTISTALTMDLDRIPVAVITPSAMTSTAITFEASDDAGSTWRPLYNEGTLYSIAISASESRQIALNRQVMEGVTLIRIIAGSTEGAARTLKIRSGLP